MKLALKQEATRLRRYGLSYSEILKRVPVAKSTLSAWLHSIGLAQEQKQRLTQKRLEAARRGGQAKRQQSLAAIKRIKQEAVEDVTEITEKDLWLMGIMLYWAEGSKDKDYKPGQGVIFSNSDPLMIKIFLKWLRICLKIPQDQLILEIYVHENHQNNIENIRKFWSSVTGFSLSKFDRIYYKKHKLGTKRRNIGNSYHGLVRIRVAQSSTLNRKIAGWIEGICMQCGVV